MQKKNGENSLLLDDEDSLLDDFVIDNLLEEEIIEFKRLMRLQKMIEIYKREPGYYI